MNARTTALNRLLLLTLLCSVFLAPAAMAEDYKAYYEKQKASLKTGFAAPALNTDLTLHLKDGTEYTGSLAQLTEGGVQIMVDEIPMSFRKHELSEQTCAKLYAEEYAHVEAMTRTRAYRDKVKSGQGGPAKHIAVLTVKNKVDRASEREGSTEQKEEGTWERETTTRTSVQNLDITIANRSAQADSYSIEWYFFSEKVDEKGIRIHSQGSADVKVDAGRQIKRAVKSESYVTKKKVNNFVACCGKATYNEKQLGLDDKGYLVVVKCGDKVLTRKASNKAYLNVDWVTLCRQRALASNDKTR